jgi:queuine tRNA-ribosyltransferase
MNWERVVFTDCGGFQLIRKDFSFKLSEEGMSFKMRDGAPFVLDPVSSIHLQEEMRSDVAFSLDDCPPLGSDRDRVLLSMERTTKWAKASLEAHEWEDTLLFGIVQGGLEADLRADHAHTIGDMGFDGYGIGGLGLGEAKEATAAMVEASLKGLPRESPKHLLGIGSLEDLAYHISMGVDTFDSAFPTRNARHGAFFVGTDTRDIRKTGYEGSVDSLEKDCDCYACSEFTSGYIHHLYREKEMLAMRLLSIHNLAVVERWMGETRTRIREGTFTTPTAKA